MSGVLVLVFVILIALGVASAVALGNKDRQAHFDRIEKTKLLTTNKRSQSSLGKYYEFNEATFMLYYKDGTHEAKTVDTTDKKTYDAYMSKLEI